MHRTTTRRAGVWITLSLLVSGLSVASASSSTAADPRIDLPRPAHGAAALRLVEGRIDDAAAVNGISAERLSGLLREDSTTWLDRDGALFFKEPVLDAPQPPEDDPVAQAPLAETFQLHSLPGARQTIFLDFDGAQASATGWHASYPGVPVTQPAWDPAGNGPSFTDAELAQVQTVWKIVAEDYAPFDVDVTTADPGPEAINRSSAADLQYGSHVVVTPSVATQDAICPGGCGGVAYINVFGRIQTSTGAGGDGYGYRQPAWVFSHMLSESAKSVGEAASHEAGHNLNLGHDANTSSSYEPGHNAWAPIMGVGYYRPISQWSQGSYPDADNQEDDVAIIGGIIGLRTDETPGTIAGAGIVPSGTAYITGRGDVDTFLLGSCSGTVGVTATAAELANLDIRLSLLNSAGVEVVAANPASGMSSASVATGMSASVSYGAAPGVYYASVDGVGNGPWSTGYDDYGSLGAYTLAATGCVAPRPTTTTLTSTLVDRVAQLSATVTATAGAPIGTVEFRDSGVLVGTGSVSPGSPTATMTTASLPNGVHDFRARFVPASLVEFAGSESAVSSLTVAPATTTTGLDASAVGQTVTLVAPVVATSGDPAGVVQFRDGATVVGTSGVGGGSSALVLTGVAAGTHSYTATFTPADPQLFTASASPARVVTVAAPAVTTPPPAVRAASTTRISAPKKAPAGSRPKVTITVTRGTAPVTGQVIVTVGAKKKLMTLGTTGVISLKVPRLRGSKLKISAVFTGTALVAPSTASRTITVKKRR
ncbi:Ig-like domain-containing protein [Nocardioides currus]|uniref:Bacterial Ig-like domain-containing protein n=1 Tax=Nocardioides currus TaxID=2133958 RepID=A0A2R7YU86_9ACTN|nr:Ig-like domain-containing protein [Nocardioides currus]PUA79942.1 hypothetical protein C7S10_15370 [Nocardioides currus]